MSSIPPIFLITGVPGAGKTSVAEMLMQRFPFGVHIPVDSIRDWVQGGKAHPLPLWTDEATRQFRLARRMAVETARLYGAEGFAAAIDDVVFPEEAERIYVEPLSGHLLHKVLLRPKIETALDRNATRLNKIFDTGLLTEFIPGIHEAMSESEFREAGWMVIDSSELTIEGTVDDILRRVG